MIGFLKANFQNVEHERNKNPNVDDIYYGNTRYYKNNNEIFFKK